MSPCVCVRAQAFAQGLAGGRASPWGGGGGGWEWGDPSRRLVVPALAHVIDMA